MGGVRQRQLSYLTVPEYMTGQDEIKVAGICPY